MEQLNNVELIFLLLLAFVVGFGTIARLLHIPYPIVLVIGGLLVSLVPGLPRVVLKPDLIFAGMLPPLLFSTAFETSWEDLRANSTVILSLAFGLVGFTAAGVAFAAHWLLPGFDWRLGLVLGAVLSPTDAIAATAIAKRIGLPKRVVDILEGESLVNDASGLLALEVTLGIVLTGETPSVAHAFGNLFLLVAGGIAAGLVVGWVVLQFETWINDGPIEVTASILTPYVAYFAAETFHSSGVLAAVACGLFLGRRSSSFFSSDVRLQTASTWGTLAFILNGIAFLLIGLQLPTILHEIRSVDRRQIWFCSIVTTVVIIALRLIWVFPSSAFANWLRSSLSIGRGRPIAPKRLFIIGWTGMRGVVSLAAAFSLPFTLDDGTPFPQRNVILFVTFFVIFVTLVLQGLTLPSIIRVLDLSRHSAGLQEERQARQYVLKAVLAEAESMRSQSEPEKTAIVEDFTRIYRRRLAALESGTDTDDEPPADGQLIREVSQQLRAFERSSVMKLRHESKIGEATMRKLERE
jgi:monovalent cation/hydrogen antiporter